MVTTALRGAAGRQSGLGLPVARCGADRGASPGGQHRTFPGDDRLGDGVVCGSEPRGVAPLRRTGAACGRERARDQSDPARDTGRRGEPARRLERVARGPHPRFGVAAPPVCGRERQRRPARHQLERLPLQQFDALVESPVLPMQRRSPRQERLWVTICYVAFTEQNPDAPYAHENTEEYAEFVLATILHARGWVHHPVHRAIHYGDGGRAHVLRLAVLGAGCPAAGRRALVPPVPQQVSRSAARHRRCRPERRRAHRDDWSTSAAATKTSTTTSRSAGCRPGSSS